MNIKQLIHHVLRRDPSSEKELYRLLYVHHFKIAEAYCDNEEEARSIFNHAAMDIFDNLKSYETEGDFLRWSARVIKNDCIDHNRKKCVYRNKLEVLKSTTKDSPSNNDALDSLYYEDVHRLLKHLKPKYRLCFILHVLEGYTYEEIAQELDININTAKWYSAEAKKKLKSLLTHNNTMLIL